jgi:hypothetical protein
MLGSSWYYGPQQVLFLFIFHIVFVFEAVQTKRFTGSIKEMVPVKYNFHSLLLVAQKNDHG